MYNFIYTIQIKIMCFLFSSKNYKYIKNKGF